MIFRQRAHFFFLLALAFFVCNASAQAPAKGIADYQIGDTAMSNIVASAELVVIDREASAALRQKEALKIPAIVRFDPKAADAAVKKLREAFALSHDQFTIELATKFGQRQLAPAQIGSPTFREFRAAFQNSNKGFPVTPKLANEWASGGTGDETQQQLIARLKETFLQRVRPDEWP